MKTKLRLKILALLAFTVSVCSYKASATHIAAGEISVQYIGTGPTDLTYKVIVDVYYACEPMSAPPSSAGNVYYFSKNAGDAGLYDLTEPSVNCVQSGTEVIIDKLCPASTGDNICNFPGTSQNLAYKYWRSEATVTLPSQQSDWTFYWIFGTRNLGILNLLDPGNQGVFLEAHLDNLSKYNNFTPVFISDPIPFVCLNSPVSYFGTATGSSNDSVTIENIVPRIDHNSDCTYDNANGYSLTNPIPSTTGNPYNVNLNTGIVSFTPTQAGLYVLGHRAKMYNRTTKQLTGFAERFVQVAVLNTCGNVPVIDGPKNVSAGSTYNSNTKTITTYEGTKLEFDISSTLVPTRKQYMTTDVASIPGATLPLTGNGSQQVGGKFSWMVTTADIGDHLLNVMVKDSTCSQTSPMVTNAYKQITIRVLPEPVGIKQTTSGKFSIAPNPATDVVNISSELFLSGDYKIDIINNIGQVVYSEVTRHIAQQQLSLSNLPAGMYIMQISNAAGDIYRQKLMKH